MPPEPATLRRIAGVAAASGAVAAAFSALAAVLVLEARLAKKWVGTPSERPPATSGWYGHSTGDPLHLTVIGDSTVAGVGVPFAHETMPAILAAGLAAVARRPVRLTNLGVSGARTSDLDAQVRRAVTDPPDVAVVVVGANDVTHQVPPATSARLLGGYVRQLRAAGIPVVVGTCPDLGTVRPLAPPLRQVGWIWSRELARRQTISAVEAGARAVSLGQLLGPSFASDPLMWSPDRFHPSAEGYAASASVLLPSVAVAVGALPETPPARVGLPGRTMSLRRAAGRAVRRPGIEVSAVGRVAAASRARLRRRRLPLRLPARPDSRQTQADSGESAPTVV